MPKLKPNTMIPSVTEDAMIDAGIAADPDTYELSDAQFKQLRPARGRPKSPDPKELISIRLSSEVLAAFRASGDGWQTRIDEALKTYLKEHKAA